MSDFLWAAILGMFAVTYLIRASFIVFGHRLRFSSTVVQTLNHVPVAVLAAIIVPEAMAPGGQLNFSLSNPYLIGTLLSGLVAWKTGRVFAAVGIGFCAFGLLRWLA